MPQTSIDSATENKDAPAQSSHRKTPIGTGRAGVGVRFARLRRSSRGAVVLALTFLAIAACPARGQDERRTKVPVIGKIAGGSTRQAFSGKVQSLDLKRKLLMVQTVEGGATEFFPVKKDVPVETARGERLKVKELLPGTNVIVYYEVKEDRRSVSEIMVLGSGGGEEKEIRSKEKTKPAPPS